MPAHVLRQVRPDHALLLHGTLPPAHLHARPYYRDARLRALARTNAPRAGHVHVGASLSHDIEPANELGLPNVWINRTVEPATVQPTRQLPDLFALPEPLDELVAA